MRGHGMRICTPVNNKGEHTHLCVADLLLAHDKIAELPISNTALQLCGAPSDLPNHLMNPCMHANMHACTCATMYLYEWMQACIDLWLC